MRTLCAAILVAVATLGCGTTAPSSNGDGLRIRNVASVPIESLVVQFPDEAIEFGTVAPGATSDYRGTSKGVYPYSAFRARVNGATIAQPVIDWLGAEPMDGDAFTYVIDVIRVSDRPVINIVTTTKDR